MALLNSEIARIKGELGYNLLTVGAEPFVNVVALFEQVIQPYLGEGATTTSSTAVVSSAAPEPVAITLDDATGFAQFDRVAVDVYPRQEIATIQSVSGSDIYVMLYNEHTGTYPVTVEGGESMVREALSKISEVKREMSDSYGAGSLKKVDEIEFHSTGNMTYFGTLGDSLTFWRNELASYLGVQNMFEYRRSASSRRAIY